PTASRSRPRRNAASVLPEPVGADSRTWSPAAIAGQARRWARVGSANALANQSRTSGVNVARGSDGIEPISVTPGSARPERAPGYKGHVSDLEPGSEFAGHRIEEVVGHGGMGVVYRAVHVALGRTVALKILAPELAGNDEFQTRFRQESKLAASIDHPNVIPIFDAGEDGDSLYVTMRFVAGTDLRQLAAGGGLDPARAARIVAQAAEALDAAHAGGLVHRDVKPGNVLIESH